MAIDDSSVAAPPRKSGSEPDAFPYVRPSRIFAMGALLLLAVIAAYATVVEAPFIFDDVEAILKNTSIEHLSDIERVLSPNFGSGNTVTGRPILNFTFALNFAAGGHSVFGYHAVNILIHLGGGLVLFGILRRTLLSLPLRGQFIFAADQLAFGTTTLWLLHPLQTESVSYVAQRAESLMGLFYLLTLYSFIRGVTGGRNGTWHLLAVVCCTCGMATKEVMVTAPIVVALYDRTFVAGSFVHAWRQRRRFYLSLFSTWLLLAGLVVGAGNRGGTIGNAAGVTWWQYALCQSRALWRYASLVVWPHPLIFDYGSDFVSFRTAAPYLLGIMLVIGATIWGVGRRSTVAFAIACFLGILVPSSSVVGGTLQMLAEHRMYLSLAPALAAIVSIGYLIGGKRMLFAIMSAAVTSGMLTFLRNRDYRSEAAIWSDTVQKRPQNPVAHFNLAGSLIRDDNLRSAAVELRKAIALEPQYANAHANLGTVLYLSGEPAEAVAEYSQAVRLNPKLAEAYCDLGYVLTQSGNANRAINPLTIAIQLRPDYADAHNNLAIALVLVGRIEDAIEQAQIAVRLAPKSAKAHKTLGSVLARSGKFEEAGDEFAKAVVLNPTDVDARENLARARRQQRALGPVQP